MYNYPCVLIIRKFLCVVDSFRLRIEQLYSLTAACHFYLPLFVFLAFGNMVGLVGGLAVVVSLFSRCRGSSCRRFLIGCGGCRRFLIGSSRFLVRLGLS
jgi:hypothetical protein